MPVLLCTFTSFQERGKRSQRPQQNLSAHTAIVVRNMDKGFITARGGKQGGQCFGKEMEKEGNSQQVRDSLSI